MASTSNATNLQQPTTHRRSASPRYHSCHTLSQCGTNPVARRRSERHPCDSRQESAEDGPNTRRAAVRACKCLRAMVNQYGSIIQEVHKAARIHTQISKGTAGLTAQYRPQGGELPVIFPELTSELLHCLSTLPDPWSLAEI